MNPIVLLYFGFFLLLAGVIGGLVYLDRRNDRRKGHG
jgi:hypothetical protein